MRRTRVIGLVAAVLLPVLIGGYSAFWYIAAGRIESGLTEAADSLRAQNLDLSWRQLAVGGFPLGFRVVLGDARLRDTATPSRGEAAIPRLEAGTSVWNFRVWRIAAPGGVTLLLGPADAPTGKITAPSATGTVAALSDGGARLWLALDKPHSEQPLRLAAAAAQLWLNLPPHPPQTHSEPMFGVALDISGLDIPQVPPPLSNPLDEVALGATLMGPFPAGPLRQAATAWRDDGGTLEIDNIALRSGAMAVTGSGTLALGPDLQPIGGFSGGVEGYDQLMRALVASGYLRPSDAQIAQLALAMLSRPGPDGRPQIRTAFTIQNGEMFLGPAKIGRAPRIPW